MFVVVLFTLCRFSCASKATEWETGQYGDRAARTVITVRWDFIAF